MHTATQETEAQALPRLPFCFLRVKALPQVRGLHIPELCGEERGLGHLSQDIATPVFLGAWGKRQDLGNGASLVNIDKATAFSASSWKKKKLLKKKNEG